MSTPLAQLKVKGQENKLSSQQMFVSKGELKSVNRHLIKQNPNFKCFQRMKIQI